MVDDYFDDEAVRRQEARDRQEATQARPRPEPPDEPAGRRTPTTQEVLHRAEALAAISMPTNTPATPINDTGKLSSMARMGGEVDPGLGAAGPTTAGEDIERQVDRILDGIGAEILDGGRR